MKRIVNIALVFTLITAILCSQFSALAESFNSDYYSDRYVASKYLNDLILTAKGSSIEISIEAAANSICYAYTYSFESSSHVKTEYFTVGGDSKAVSSIDFSSLPNGQYRLDIMYKSADQPEKSITENIRFVIVGGLPKFLVSGTDSKILEILSIADKDYLTTDIPGINSQIATIAAQLKAQSDSDYETIVAVHDWVADYLYYDFDGIEDGTYSNDINTVFNTRRAVCQGYAELCDAMLRSVDIPSVWVAGDATGYLPDFEVDHAWNIAFDGTDWVIFDATWDSKNTFENGTYNYGGYVYTYFDVDPESFSITHRTIDLFDIKIGEITYEFFISDEDEYYAYPKRYISTSGVCYLPDDICGFPLDLTYLNVRENISITHFRFPSYIKKIDDATLYGCSNLKTVELPALLTTIGLAAFHGCSKLESILIPHGTTTIGGFAFNGCSSLNTINLPNTVNKIEEYAFQSCTGLEKITIPNPLAAFGVGALNTFNPRKTTVYGIAGSTVNTFVNNTPNHTIFAVIVPVIGLAFEQNRAFLQVGSYLSIPAVTTPDNASSTAVIYASSDPNVCTVDNNGKITGLKQGKSIISATDIETGITDTLEVYIGLPEALIKESFNDVGTAIRTTGQQALRFKTSIPTAALSDGYFGDYTLVEYGTIAIKTSYLNGQELKMDIQYTQPDSSVKTSLKGPAYIKGQKNMVLYYDDSIIHYSAALVNISTENYANQYNARAYAVLQAPDGTRYTIYDDETRSASVYEVADKAYNAKNYDGSFVESEDTRNYLLQNILKVVNPNY